MLHRINIQKVCSASKIALPKYDGFVYEIVTHLLVFACIHGITLVRRTDTLFDEKQIFALVPYLYRRRATPGRTAFDETSS